MKLNKPLLHHFPFPLQETLNHSRLGGRGASLKEEDLNFAKITLFRPADNGWGHQKRIWENFSGKVSSVCFGLWGPASEMEAATFKVRDCNSWHWIQSSSAHNGAEKDDKIFGQILFGGCGGGDRLRCRPTLYLGSRLESCPGPPACLATALYKRFKSSIIPNQTGRSYMNILNTPKMNGNWKVNINHWEANHISKASQSHIFFHRSK